MMRWAQEADITYWPPYLYACRSALRRRANCVYQHRNSDNRNDVTEQVVKATEWVDGKLCHVRRNAIVRAIPAVKCPGSSTACGIRLRLLSVL